jgi:hypothetical protein
MSDDESADNAQAEALAHLQNLNESIIRGCGARENDYLPDPTKLTLAELWRLCWEIEQRHQTAGSTGEAWSPEIESQQITRRMHVMHSATGFREFKTCLNAEFHKDVTPEAIREVETRLAGLLGRPFDEIGQLTLPEALEALKPSDDKALAAPGTEAATPTEPTPAGNVTPDVDVLRFIRQNVEWLETQGCLTLEDVAGLRFATAFDADLLVEKSGSTTELVDLIRRYNRMIDIFPPVPGKIIRPIQVPGLDQALVEPEPPANIHEADPTPLAGNAPAATAEPDAEKFKAYLAAHRGIRQCEIAVQLGVSQPTVSRWIADVEKFKAKGGDIPGLDDLNKKRPKHISEDPRVREQGPRLDGRRPKPRGRE